jgi:hypothetical protein
MLRMKNWKLQLNLKMLKDELDEQRAPEKSRLPCNKSSCCRGTLHQLQETTQIKETREVVVQATHFMLVDEATQTKKAGTSRK